MAWKCEVCGYVHTGDEPPHECPVCGVGPEMFVRFEIAAPPETTRTRARIWRCRVCGYLHDGDEPPGECPLCNAGREEFEPADELANVTAAASPPQRIVVLGGGVAAVTAAEQARRIAPEATITLVSREPGLPYYRLNLTRLLAGEIDEATLPLKPEPWFTEARIRLLHDEALAIDREHHEVQLRESGTLAYDRLVLATGSHAFVPPVPGADLEGVMTLRTLEDVRAVRARVRDGGRCVCIGGGLLGLETAGALSRLGMSVTVVEGFGWLLPRQLPEAAGRRLARHLERLGIAVRCGARVEALEGSGAVERVRLQGAEPLPADLVVLSAGVRPNSHLARRAGIDVKSGILVDDRLATTDPAVFAAGDVAEHRGLCYGIWPAAYAQGAVAGTNAAGGAAEFRGLPPSNRLKVLDVDLYSIGQVNPSDASCRIVEREDDSSHIRLVVRDGALVGASLFGETSLASVVKEAIEGGVQVATVPALCEQVPGLV